MHGTHHLLAAVQNGRSNAHVAQKQLFTVHGIAFVTAAQQLAEDVGNLGLRIPRQRRALHGFQHGLPLRLRQAAQIGTAAAAGIHGHTAAHRREYRNVLRGLHLGQIQHVLPIGFGQGDGFTAVLGQLGQIAVRCHDQRMPIQVVKAQLHHAGLQTKALTARMLAHIAQHLQRVHRALGRGPYAGQFHPGSDSGGRCQRHTAPAGLWPATG